MVTALRTFVNTRSLGLQMTEFGAGGHGREVNPAGASLPGMASNIGVPTSGHGTAVPELAPLVDNHLVQIQPVVLMPKVCLAEGSCQMLAYSTCSHQSLWHRALCHALIQKFCPLNTLAVDYIMTDVL